MTDQRARGPGRGEAAPPAGYRGALPPRNDSLARPWVLIVVIIFFLIFALSFANVPTQLFPSPTPAPLPSFSVAPSPSASASASASESASAEASGSGSASPSASVSPTGSPAP